MKLFKSQDALIAEIHDAFDSAQERLLSQAMQVLTTRNEKVESVSERLRKVGFVNTPTAKEGVILKDKIVTSTEQAEIIQYYKQTYPFLKFLTVDELDTICDKYSLIHAPVGNYMKEVPEKNLRDIERAQQLKSQDLEETEYLLKSRPYYEKGFKKLMKHLGYPDCKLTTKQAKEICSNHNTSFWSDEGLTENGWLFNVYCTYDDRRDEDYEYNYNSVEKIQKDGLFIAAPRTHFDLKGLDKKSKHGFFSVLKTEVKDPIVFRYVKGGIQVLTKWGREAEDPLLVLRIDN